jgi:hypothetical protein
VLTWLCLEYCRLRSQHEPIAGILKEEPQKVQDECKKLDGADSSRQHQPSTREQRRAPSSS